MTDSILLAYGLILDQRAINGLLVTGAIAFNNQAQGVVPEESLLTVILHEIGHVVRVSLLSQSPNGASSHFYIAHFFFTCDFFISSFIAWYWKLVDTIFSVRFRFSSLRIHDLRQSHG